MFVIPIGDLNSQAVEAVLDDTLYYIVVNWNQTGGVWELGIRNSAYRVLLTGVRMVPMYPLLRQFKYPECPPGELVIFDYTLSKSQRIPRDGFSSVRYELIYYTAEELLLIEAGNVI